MTSNYSRSSDDDDDDFYKYLDRSLSSQLSIVLQPNFVPDLINAINNLDDDYTGDGFLFHEDDKEYASTYEWFTSQFSENGVRYEQQQLPPNKEDNDEISGNGADNVSVDMFAEFEDDQEIFDAESEHIDQMSIYEQENVQFSQKEYSEHMSVALCDISTVSSGKNVEILEECSFLEKSLRVQHGTNRLLRQQTPVSEVPPVVVQNLEHEELGEMVVCIPSSIISSTNDKSMERSPSFQHRTNQILRQQSQVPIVENLEDDEHGDSGDMVVCIRNSIISSTNDKSTERTLRVLYATNQILRQQSSLSEVPPIVENLEYEELGDSGDMVVCIPSSIISSTNDKSTYCEPYENSRALNVELPTSHQNVQPSSTGLNRFPCEGTRSAEPTESRFLPTIREKVNSSFSGSLGEDFLGFSSLASFRNVAMLHQRKQSSSKSRNNIESVLNTTVCEEYEATRNPNVGSDLNTTVCEEYETSRNPAPDTSISNFDLDEAYTQCFLGSQNDNLSSNAERRQQFIDEIEKLILKITNDVISRRKLKITVPYKLTWDNCVFDNGRLRLQPMGNGQTRKIESNRKISMILYVLSYVYKLLINNSICTKREIYYSDPELTQSQNAIDEAVKDICLILDARPWEIGILSSSKGLIAGSIKLTLNNDSVIDVGSINGGILLPHLTTMIQKVETAAKFVLLVEKHTIYERLLTEDILGKLNPCILVTGKGYPDINTRSILKKIWDDCKCPIYALVDADPHGIEIMLTYRYGSLNMSYCNDDLAIPSIRWIGVYPSEIKSLRLPGIPVTNEDLYRIDAMIKRPYMSTPIYKELLQLKTNKLKTEVEGLTSAGIIDWINSYLLKKIKSGNFI